MILPLSSRCRGSTQLSADASSRCVTPTWDDPARTSLSSAGLGKRGRGACSRHERFSQRSRGMGGQPPSRYSSRAPGNSARSHTLKERRKTGPKSSLELHCHPYSMSSQARPRLTTYLACRESHPGKLSLSFPGPWSPTPPTQPCHATLGWRDGRRCEVHLRPGIVGGCGKFAIENAHGHVLGTAVDARGEPKSLLRAHCPVGECISSNYNLMFYNRDAQEVIHQMVPLFRQGRGCHSPFIEVETMAQRDKLNRWDIEVQRG